MNKLTFKITYNDLRKTNSLLFIFLSAQPASSKLLPLSSWNKFLMYFSCNWSFWKGSACVKVEAHSRRAKSFRPYILTRRPATPAFFHPPVLLKMPFKRIKTFFFQRNTSFRIFLIFSILKSFWCFCINITIKVRKIFFKTYYHLIRIL